VNTIKELDLETLLGGRLHRLQGVTTATLPLLGSVNLRTLIGFARENATLRQAEAATYEELKEIRAGIEVLENLLLASDTIKPRLPRLRVESFRTGESVMLYIGDSDGTICPTPWVPTTICSVQKSHNPRWNDGSPNGGYYWRVTVKTPTSVFTDNLPLAFSTSEPRALPQADYDYLVWARENDRAFFEIFCANAYRTWTPLWCEERGLVCVGNSNVGVWF
jgi:hypothetical protein